MRFYVVIILILMGEVSLAAPRRKAKPRREVPVLSIPRADCEEVNLIRGFEKINICDKKQAAICYACAAANLADYHLIKLGAPEQQIHPIWAAYVQSVDLVRTNFDGGYIEQTIEQLIKQKNCAYPVVASQLSTICQETGMTEPEIFALLDQVEQMLPFLVRQKEAKIRRKCSFKQLMELKRNAFRSTLRTMGVEKRVKPGSLQKLLELTPDLKSMDAFLKLTSNECAPEKRQSVNLPDPKTIKLPINSDTALFTLDLKRRLRDKQIPAALSFCANFYDDPKFMANPNFFLGDGEWYVHPECQEHTALVVGQKKIGDSCHLLMRESFGPDWWGKSEVKTCLCKRKDISDPSLQYDDCTEEEFKQGNRDVVACWVPQDRILKNSVDFTVIE